jgi:hypothetical protein
MKIQNTQDVSVSIGTRLWAGRSQARFVAEANGFPLLQNSGVPRNFVWGRGGGSTNSVEDRGQREWGAVGGSRLVRGFGGSCNLAQEISFHIVFNITT